MNTSSSSSAYHPPGSKLLFLRQLPSCAVNTRVRFLGCITSYDAIKAQLTLSHPPSSVFVRTDVSVLVQALPMGALRNGEWVNVIGDTLPGGEVRAVMLWSAAGIDLGNYEKTLRALECDGVT